MFRFTRCLECVVEPGKQIAKDERSLGIATNDLMAMVTVAYIWKERERERNKYVYVLCICMYVCMYVCVGRLGE